MESESEIRKRVEGLEAIMKREGYVQTLKERQEALEWVLEDSDE